MSVQRKAALSFWLGASGGVLLLAGLILLIMGRWSTIPHAGQVALVFVPLLCAYVMFYYDWRTGGKAPTIIKELQGFIWCAGVCCTTFLLNNVLQYYQSDNIVYWQTALLLLPAACFTRSIVAFFYTIHVFIIALFSENISAEEPVHGFLFLAAFLAACVTVFIHVRNYWKEESGYSVFCRWVVALSVLYVFWVVSIQLHDLIPDSFVTVMPSMFLALCGAVLLAGLCCEPANQNIFRRTLTMVFSIVLIVFPLVYHLSYSLLDMDKPDDEFSVIFCAVSCIPAVCSIFMKSCRWDSALLWIIPVTYFYIFSPIYLLAVVVYSAAGTYILLRGIYKRCFFDLNLGAVFILTIGGIESFRSRLDMVSRGVFMMIAGAFLIAVNIVLLRYWSRHPDTEE